MPVNEAFIEQCRDLFEPFGAVSVRKMFGGAGLYVDGRICAVLDDEALYLKADDVSIPQFEAARLGPFEFDFGDGKRGTMNYYAAPEDVFDDPDVAEAWIRLALQAAMRAPPPKKRIRK